MLDVRTTDDSDIYEEDEENLQNNQILIVKQAVILHNNIFQNSVFLKGRKNVVLRFIKVLSLIL